MMFMIEANFPDTPESEEKFVLSTFVFKYSSDRWNIVKFQPADSGLIDCGSLEPVKIKINGGLPVSDYVGLASIDCGGV